MKLSVIIVSYNTSQLLRTCLEKVFHSLSSSKLRDKTEVIVVDNASKDDSVIMVRKNFPRVRLFINKENKGFAQANNMALSIVKGEYVLLLNSDTEVGNETIVSMLRIMDADTTIGVLGCRLNNTDGSLQPSVGYFPNMYTILFWMLFLDDLPVISSFVNPYHVNQPQFYERVHEVDWITGACMFVRRSCLANAGSIDAHFFMYGEEIEWCYRIKKNGGNIRYVPDASITHVKGASSGLFTDAGIVEEFRFILYFFKKHKTKWQYPIVKMLLRLGASLRILLFDIIPDKAQRSSLYAKARSVVR